MKKINKKEITLLLLSSILFLGLGIAAMIKDTTPDWTYYQAEFRQIISENFGSVDLNSIPHGIQQIWIKELNSSDRCITCHQGIGWKGLENVEHPYRTHPNPELFTNHPIEKFGCTICHGGQGLALTEYDAHGFVKHWEEPLLGKTIGTEYDPRNPPTLGEIKCNFCHRYERETAGMELINHGKKLVREKACKVCHVINGDGGSLGPDLTHEGEKHAEGFDFSNFATEQTTILNWHINHFQTPNNVVPSTIMPEMNFQTKDAVALSMLVMSWRDNSELPLEYVPGLNRKDIQTAEEVEEERQIREGDGAFFVENSCFICHSIKGFNIKSPTEKGPDLSYAPDDVRARFSRDLEDFIFEPTGTMKIIFESQIQLSDEQKWEAIEKIRKAYNIVTNKSDEDTQVKKHN